MCTSAQATTPTEPCGAGSPTSAGIWRMMMVSARPKAKPRSTGRATNPARLPSRAAASPMNSMPTSRVKAVALAAVMPLPADRLARLAARIAAEDDVGDTTANRLRPITA
jgi:hypothetical protein